MPVTVPGNCNGSVVFFEPDPVYTERYQAYPCPGIFDTADLTVIRLLNGSADQTLPVVAGMQFGCAQVVRQVANGFYRELDSPADGEFGLTTTGRSTPSVSLGLTRGRVLTIDSECRDRNTPASDVSNQHPPTTVVTPAEPSAEDDISEAYRRYLLQ